MNQRWPRGVLAVALSVGMALPAQAQVLGTGVLQVQEIGAQLFHATVTAVQSTISAVEDVIQTASALQELVPLDAILVAEGIAEDLAALADIIRQVDGLSYDIQSLQAQIDALFNLDTAPDGTSALRERLNEIRRVRVQAYTYAMRLQTLMTTALRTVDHLILLVNSIANFLGAKQGMQTSSSSMRPSVRRSLFTRPSRQRISGPGASTR